MSAIHTTSDTFAEQIAKLVGAHTSYCTASALFYWGDSTEVGLRIQAPLLAKEFIDKVAFGHDPEGLLFYSDSEDFDIEEDVPWTCTMNSESPPAVRVDFGTHTHADRIWASFITKDTNNATAHFKSFAGNGKGKWVNDRQITTYALFEQYDKETDVELNLELIGKSISWQMPAAKKSIRIHGNFSFRKFSDLKKDTKATIDYNEDRVVFYDANKTMLGVFFPATPINGSNTNAAGTFSDVTA